jgi:hypothetical protein
LKEGISYIALKNISKIIKTTEEEVKEIFDNSSLIEPINSDLVLSKRNMAYNKIKAEIKNFKKEIKKKKTEEE